MQNMLYDPFILPQKEVRQVYSVPYPATYTTFRGWCIALTIKQNNNFKVDNCQATIIERLQDLVDSQLLN